jgi:hypothetical protein
MFIIKQFINGINLTFLYFKYFKYFFYFNLFILTFIANILYYYFFLKTNKKFIDLLYYSIIFMKIAIFIV